MTVGTGLDARVLGGVGGNCSKKNRLTFHLRKECITSQVFGKILPALRVISSQRTKHKTQIKVDKV